MVFTVIPPTLMNITTQGVPIIASTTYYSPTIMASVMSMTTLLIISMVLTFTMTLPPPLSFLPSAHYSHCQ